MKKLFIISISLFVIKSQAMLSDAKIALQEFQQRRKLFAEMPIVKNTIQNRLQQIISIGNSLDYEKALANPGAYLNGLANHAEIFKKISKDLLANQFFGKSDDQIDEVYKDFCRQKHFIQALKICREKNTLDTWQQFLKQAFLTFYYEFSSRGIAIPTEYEDEEEAISILLCANRELDPKKFLPYFKAAIIIREYFETIALKNEAQIQNHLENELRKLTQANIALSDKEERFRGEYEITRTNWLQHAKNCILQ
jgi:hypothetical protein